MVERETALTTATPVAPERARRGDRAKSAELAARLSALGTCSYDDLRMEWRRLYRAHPPKKISRDLLELGVAWKLQERGLGGPGAALRRRLADLAETLATKGDLARARAVTLRPGARLVRAWHGQVHEVLVVEDGFHWQGERWRSLTAIAHAITGTHWSGPRFFGLAGTAPASVGQHRVRDPESAADSGKASTGHEPQSPAHLLATDPGREHRDGAGPGSQGGTVALAAKPSARARKGAERPRRPRHAVTATTPTGPDGAPLSTVETAHA
jgi:hypothetical protein